MFNFFKKTPQLPTLKNSPIEFYLANCERDIASCRRAIPKNYTEDNFKYITWNSNDALRRILTRHALQLRAKHASDLAMSELSSATEFLDHIENAIAKADAKGLILPADKEGKHESNYIEVYSLFYAFTATFLMQDWSRAGRLAESLKLPVLRENIEHEEDGDGGPYCHITKMFSAVFLNDQAEFEYQKQRYQQAKKQSYFFGKYFNYDEMMELIFADDSAEFNTYLPKLEQSYLDRKKDKKLETWDFIFGSSGSNDFIYDVWATGLCNLARHQGLSVSHSSEIIPTRLFFA
jgi:hypothetical protein